YIVTIPWLYSHPYCRRHSSLARVRYDARDVRRAPCLPHDVDRFRLLAARGGRPHDVGEIGGIDVVVDRHHDPAHVALRRRDEPRALRMPGIALLERDHGHQLGHVLPGAGHVRHPGTLEIGPDAGGPERQAEMETR